MAGVVLLSRSTRPYESMHGNAWTFSEQVVACIIYDSRCGMSYAAFRTAPQIDGPSCFFLLFLEIAIAPHEYSRLWMTLSRLMSKHEISTKARHRRSYKDIQWQSLFKQQK